MLTHHVLAQSYRSCCWRIYLFSTEAGAYWMRYGFYEVPELTLSLHYLMPHTFDTMKYLAGSHLQFLGGVTHPMNGMHNKPERSAAFLKPLITM